MSDPSSAPGAGKHPVHYRVSIFATLIFTAMMVAVYFCGVNAFRTEPTVTNSVSSAVIEEVTSFAN